MRPKPRSIMPGSTAWLAWTAPMTCTSHIAWKTDGSVLTKAPVSTEPALLTRMAMGPRAASAAVTWRLTSTASVTSATAQPAASPAATVARSGCLAASDHGHGGAGSGQRRGNRAADAASAAGDQSVLACERHIPAGRESCSR